MRRDRISFGTFMCAAGVAMLLAGLAVAQPIATGNNSGVDGYLMVAPDEYGSWASVGFGGNGDIFNPAGGDGPLETGFTSGFFLFIGASQRELLSESANWQGVFGADASLDREITAVNVASDASGNGVDDTLVGSFRVFDGGSTNLAFDVTQHVSLLGGGAALLQQDYVITNNGSAISFVMVRAFDGDLVWDGTYNDEVGTDMHGAGLGTYVFEQEEFAPFVTAVTLSGGPAGDAYYASKLGITPDGGPPAYGYGTDLQVWDAYGIPTTWRNFVPPVGYNVNGVSGSQTGGCTDPCDGAVGLDFPIELAANAATTTITMYHTYGCSSPLCELPPPTGACCLSDESCVEVTASECDAQGGTYQGTYTTCAQVDCAVGAIPTVSEWGLIIMTLLVLTAGTIILRWRHRPVAA